MTLHNNWNLKCVKFNAKKIVLLQNLIYVLYICMDYTYIHVYKKGNYKLGCLLQYINLKNTMNETQCKEK
jgi:hypothetical protein